MIVCIVCLFFSCKKTTVTNLDNYYFVKIGDAALPVRICGNANSQTAIIFVHGGPGSSAQTERSYSYWKALEANYKVVYYDQRGSGYTQGNVNEADMTLEQYSEDLDNIVDFTKEIGKVNKVFLHGASFGGALATYYLLDTSHQKKVAAAILEAPAYDMVHGSQLSIAWLMQKADSVIAENNQTSLYYWQNCKNYYAAHPVLTKDNYKQHQTYLNQVKGITFNTNNMTVQSTSKPQTELNVLYENQTFAPQTLTYEGQSVFTHLDLTARLNEFKTPVLLVWGLRDGLSPRNNLALKFFLNIGSTDKKYEPSKYLISANMPHLEEWQLFDIDAIQFIESH
ncbi:MAG: alpha/beta hydrolase [Chitinophagales bacterium]